MIRTETLAAIRFGTGLSPRLPPPAGAGALLAELAAADEAAHAFPLRPFAYWAAAGQARDAMRRGDAQDRQDGDGLAAFRAARREAVRGDLTASLARAAFGRHGFRERLTLFWSNHFAVAGRGPRYGDAAPAFVDEAIRPHLAGSFAGLLRAATLHPVMLRYLDQDRSAGPSSRAARSGRRGLNENLARELLELHTLGADGAYGQDDVEALALLLTGASFDAERGFGFRRAMAEPGEVTVLGKRYGGARPRLADIEAALEDLAAHPDTARHVAGKLAAHFVADAPDPGLVAHVAARFAATGGALPQVYEALLEHPAAWRPEPAKVRPPFDFLAAALKALDVAPDALRALPGRDVTARLAEPLRLMGQPFHQPPSPAGWPERAAHWISPQGLAARIDWAMTAPEALAPGHDPRRLVETALADAAGEELAEAVAGAESRREGVGLVLASPAFNRR